MLQFSQTKEKDLEDHDMNKYAVVGSLKQTRTVAKGWWGILTDDDLDRVAGKYDAFTSVLQDKYGYIRERAVEEIDKRVSEFAIGSTQKKVPTLRLLTGNELPEKGI